MTAETLDLLRQILGRVAAVDAKVDALRVETRGELTEIRAEIRDLHHTVADTNVRVTQLGDDLRAPLRDHERRLARLEEAALKKTA